MFNILKNLTGKGKKSSDCLTLQWCLPLSAEQTSLAEAFINTLKSHYPEALPLKYGKYEPLTNKTGPKDFELFIRSWSDCSKSPCGDMLFFHSTYPCVSGTVCIGDPRPNKVKLYNYIALNFDMGALRENDSKINALVELFKQVSVATNAFYAAAFVVRNVHIDKQTIWHSVDTEGYELLPGRGWLGLPVAPTWLAWFGGAYRAELSELEQNPLVSVEPGGLFLKIASKPLNKDQLKKVFPKLPQQLLLKHVPKARSMALDPKNPEVFAEWWSAEEFFPADYIPEL
ncbi:MAG: hypothetical protein HY986_00150 [Candidatus Melainabacteria bacterium]|nr:hypothetical protein [Candidatus Melainabacteria bacterium]